MLNFSVIPTQLEIKIAEKLSYSDIKEFEFASKHSKKIVRYVKHQPVVEVQYINVYPGEICFFDLLFGRQRVILWSTLSQYVHLPRFSLRTLTINGDLFPTIRNEVTFVNNKVHLIWCNKKSDTNQALDVISEMVTIGKFTTWCAVDPDVLNHVALRELDAVEIGVDNIPNETLLQIKLKYVVFNELTDPFRVISVSNLFFKQWFHEEREIQFLCMTTNTYSSQIVDIRSEKLFRGLSYSSVLQYEDERSRDVKFLKNVEYDERRSTVIRKGDRIYSIDRGDKKLLVLQLTMHTKHEWVIALEYTNLDDVIEFGEF